MRRLRSIPNSVSYLITVIINGIYDLWGETVKAYIRKSNILFAMRDYTKAIEAIQEANDHDVDHQHTKEISQQEMKCQQALFSQRGEESQEETLQRAMRDPEVAVRQNFCHILFLLCHSNFHCFKPSGHYERSSHAANFTASSERSWSFTGPHEKP